MKQRGAILLSIVGAAALLVGIGIGAVAKPAPDPKSTKAYKDLQSQLATAQSSLSKANDELNAAAATIAADKKTIGNLPAEQAAIQAQKAQLAAEQDALRAHEQVVNQEYNRIKNNTLAGDGVYLAGTDMQPGTYRTAGQVSCYWEVSTDANGQNIVANGNPDGPAFATVQRGQYLTVARCGDWILQR